MSRNQRWDFVRNKNLCYCCLEEHTVRSCRSKRDALLHSYQATEEAGNATTGSRRPPAVLFHGGESSKALFRYIKVQLYGRNCYINTFALVDEGAACTLIEKDLADELGLDGPEKELCLRWTGEISQTEPASKLVNLQISAANQGATRYDLKGVRTVAHLDLPIQSLGEKLIKSRSDLKSIPMPTYRNAKARLIIGLDNIKTRENAIVGVPLEGRELEGDDFVAVRCRLGWSAYGRQCSGEASRPRILHVCECNNGDRLHDLDEAMRNHFALESLGVTVANKPLRSKEDERAACIMEAKTTFDPEAKRWQTGLLWRYDKMILPNSYPMALGRLRCLEAKMAKDPALSQFLMESMKSYQEKGYTRQLVREEIVSNSNSWYLPIFTVTNPNKKKTRMVWDAAAEVNGLSLNHALLKGPDILVSLMGVLIRFR
ncbi:uncharacterized protein [Drosophila takahashii]|uniref:uncharacterized protein n=1 Tax=Drosophila takahashii TaxID=29030 RepID=UPI0038993F03